MNELSPANANTCGSLPANCEEMAFPERSSAVTVFPCTAEVLGTETKNTWWTGSNNRSLACWTSVWIAKLAPAGVVPAVVPTKNVEPAELPPLAAPLSTVMMDVPVLAMSDALIAAVSCVGEMNVVVRAEPLSFTVDVAIKLVPFTVMLNAGPPTLADPGFKDAMAGVCAVGAGVGAGVGIGVGAGEGGATGRLPPISTICPPVVLNAKPLLPHRRSRCTVPLTPGTVMELTGVKCVRSKDLITVGVVWLAK